MPWPVPAPGVISSRAAGVLEQNLPGIDARSDNTGATAITRVVELGVQDVYYEQGYFAEQLMPDTATDWLPRHAQIWGVPRDQATLAGGNGIANGTVGVDLPAGTLFQTSGTAPVQYQTTAAVTLGVNVSVPLQALLTGTTGNQDAGVVLYPVSPISDLSPQSITVDANGLTGGAAQETLDSWRTQIITKIRTEPAGGSAANCIEWAKAALPNVGYAACPPSLQEGGTAIVVVAMAGPAVPTATELAAVQAYIDARRPVTGNILVVAATLQPVDIALQVRPNSTAVQQAAGAALALFFQQNADINAPVYLSDLSAAISNADGEEYHEMTTPSADVQPTGPTSLPTLGTVSYS